MFNWASYNESLVRRGEIILDFGIIDGWYDELGRMNQGKRGAAYGYPDSFVQLLGYVKAYFHLPYRQTEGVVRAHAANKTPSIPNYSTINRRVNRLDIEINEHVGNDIVIALDSTGIKVANRGEWIRHKWNVRTGYLKIHVAVDIRKKKIVSMEVTSEEVHDDKVLKKLIDNASENNKVKRVLADGMYDSNKNFRYLSKNHINLLKLSINLFIYESGPIEEKIEDVLFMHGSLLEISWRKLLKYEIMNLFNILARHVRGEALILHVVLIYDVVQEIHS